jgi:divalent metal cation (Fe/Co/Zn/Cd) transporter
VSVPLIERSEKEIAQAVKRRVESLNDVKNCHQISVRMLGRRYDVDMHVSLDRNLKFEDVHKIASNVEREVKTLIPNARVTVHTEPVGNNRHDIWKLVKEIAEGTPGSRGVHNIHIQEVEGKTYLDFHLEVAASISVKQAHEIADQVERKLKEANQIISGITVHIESASDIISRELTEVGTDLKEYIEDVSKRFPDIKDVQGIIVSKVGDGFHVVFKCFFDPNLSMGQTHAISNKLEEAIKNAYPSVSRIDIHEEPYLKP